MSIIYKDELGYFISHKQYIDSLYNFNEKFYHLHPNLFNISSPFRTSTKSKHIKESCEDKYENLRKEVHETKSKFHSFVQKLLLNGLLEKSNLISENMLALKIARHVYEESGKTVVKHAVGSNSGPATIKAINGSKYLFPENCTFHSKDIIDIDKHLNNLHYDLILLDPPWWNKYIRRKRKKSGDGYNMMFNNELRQLPIDKLLKDDGLLIVWCTNSEQHLTYLLSDIFPTWNVNFLCKWYWLKITTSGELICDFKDPPGKQPFEKIVFGCRNANVGFPRSNKLVVSVPSALHSHKPPLIELVKEFLPDNPICLEIFARYLLPGWTSYGNEVLRFQHESLYELSSVD